jgi:hypothetical protein
VGSVPVAEGKEIVKMKTTVSWLGGAVFAAVGVFMVFAAGSAHAALYNRGTDASGNRLIYDSGLNITWYDYTYSTNNSETWGSCLNWAAALSVNHGGTIYDDWRLPTIAVLEDPRVYGFAGSTTYGYNISTSEMGHLFYEELGNKGYYATDGTSPQPGWGLANTGDFQNLQPLYYYSETDDGPWTATYFNFYNGEQYVAAKMALGGTGLVAMAVRSGDVGLVAGDVNGDGHVDVVDLLWLVDAFGSVTGDANYDARCDFNSDGSVDVVDLLDLVYNFGM